MGRPKQFEPDAVVERAMHVFWRNGYTSTTPHDLVDELGIGKGSLYNAFASKRNLFELALRRYGDMRVAGLTELLGRPGPAKPLLRTALEKLATGPAAPLRHGCLAVNTATEMASDRGATEVVTGVFDRMEGVFCAAVERGQREGEIDPSLDPRGVASMLLGTVIGLSVLARTDQGTQRRRRIIDTVLATL